MLTESAPLLREVVRLYVRAQRKQARCGDGMSTVQCHVMTELLRQQGVTQQVLVERLGMDKGWISRAVDALAAEGVITKETSTLDRRAVTLSLTSAGTQRAQALDRDLNGHAAQLMAHVPLTKQAQLTESLKLLLNALSGELAAQPVPSAGPLVLRSACQSDWPTIEQLLLLSHLPLDGARAHIANFVLGEVDGALVCVGGLEIYGSSALLRSFAVTRGAQGRGCGKQLLAQLLRRCQALDISGLYLLTTTAAAYFARQGFTELARAEVPQPVHASREFSGICPASATVMVRRLSPSDLT